MSRQKEQLPVKEVTEHFISGQDRKKKGRERIETTREGKEPRLKKDKRTKRKTSSLLHEEQKENLQVCFTERTAESFSFKSLRPQDERFNTSSCLWIGTLSLEPMSVI